jgi:prenyltransferase beta subunit
MKKIKIIEKNEVHRIAYSDFQHFISPKEFFQNPPETILLNKAQEYDLVQHLEVDEHFTILKLQINNKIYWSYAQFEVVDEKSKKQNGIISIKAKTKEEIKKAGKVTFVVV